MPEDVERQLRRELALIEELDYGGYFLTMYEIVQYCRRNAIRATSKPRRPSMPTAWRR